MRTFFNPVKSSKIDLSTYQNLTNRVKEQVTIAVYLSSKIVTKQYILDIITKHWIFFGMSKGIPVSPQIIFGGPLPPLSTPLD